MSRVATVRKADLDRVLKALRDAGQTVGKVLVRPGEVEILPGSPEAALTPLEQWRVEHGRG